MIDFKLNSLYSASSIAAILINFDKLIPLLMAFFKWNDEKKTRDISCLKNCRILVIGGASSGKTSLLSYLINESPIAAGLPGNPTRACNVKIKNYTSRNSNNYWLEFLEIGGQFHHPNTNNCFFKHYDAIIAVFDVTDILSFEKLEELLSQALNYRGNQPIIVVGTRNDLLNSSGFYSANSQLYQNHFYYNQLSSMGVQVLGLSLLHPPDPVLWSSFFETTIQKMNTKSNSCLENSAKNGHYSVKID